MWRADLAAGDSVTTRYDRARLPAALLLAFLLVQPASAQTGEGAADGSAANGRTTLPVVVAPTGPLSDDASAPDPAFEPDPDSSGTATDAATEPDPAPETVAEAGPSSEPASEAEVDTGSGRAAEPEPVPVSESLAEVLAEPGPDLAMLRPGPASAYDGSPAEAMILPASCADMTDPSFPGAFTEPTPLPEGAPGLVVYSRDDDFVRLLQTDEAVRVEASAGDDTVYAIGVRDRVEIAGGGGGDTIVVCTMAGAELHILMGRGVVPMDRFPDAVVIDFGVFADASGIERQIWVEGFLSVNDRLELRVPPNLEIETVRAVRGVPEEFRVGDMTLYLNAGGTVPAAPDGFDPASIVIVAGEAP